MREVENGEIVVIENGKLDSIKPFPKQKARPCVLNIFILLDQTVLINGKCAYEYRKKLGNN